MSWFDITFLPSLFERAGTNKPMWLTKKQTAVCVDNMEKRTVRTAEFQGDYASHFWYSYTWGEREVRLNYSKLNGCGTIEFSFNEAEREIQKAKNEEEKARIKDDRLRLLSTLKQRNPERWEKRFEVAKKAYHASIMLLKQEEEAFANGDISFEYVERAKDAVSECKEVFDALIGTV